jgi:signal transduction histidine kinase
MDYDFLDESLVSRAEREQTIHALYSSSVTMVQLPPILARYIRVKMTELRPEPRLVPAGKRGTEHADAREQNYYAALAELQVLDESGRNVALGASVGSAERGLEGEPEGDAGSGLKAIVDGQTGCYAVWSSDQDAGAHTEDLEDQALKALIAGWRRLVIIVSMSGLGVVAVLTAGLYWTFGRRRAAQADHLRRQIADDLHDEVGGNLGAIRMLSQAATESSQKQLDVRDDLQRISHLAAETADTIRDIVWLIDGGQCTLREMLERMRLVAENTLAGLDHAIDVRCEAQNIDRTIAANLRRHLLLALKEALNNAVRHSAATRVEVVIEATDRALSFRVSDNGKGILHKGNGGRGLKTLRQRAEAVKGELTIQTQPAQGVTIDFRTDNRKS